MFKLKTISLSYINIFLFLLQNELETYSRSLVGTIVL